MALCGKEGKQNEAAIIPLKMYVLYILLDSTGNINK